MFDGPAIQTLQRSRGFARLEVCARAGAPAVRGLRQSGSAKAFLPGRAPDAAIFLNTSGGLTGGDRLEYALDLGSDLRLAATTQTAERAYASQGQMAEVAVQMQVAPGAHLDWLPQETLLYEGSALARDTRIDLAGPASTLLCEMIVLGRHAMGEFPAQLRLRDRRRVFRDGRIVWADSLMVDAGALARQGSAAILGNTRCHAVIALVDQGAEDATGALRPLLAADGVEGALSAWNGRLILRMTARDSWPMKVQLARILSQLRGRPVPRAWQMNGDIP